MFFQFFSSEIEVNTLLPPSARYQTPWRRLIEVWFMPSVPILARNSRFERTGKPPDVDMKFWHLLFCDH